MYNEDNLELLCEALEDLLGKINKEVKVTNDTDIMDVYKNMVEWVSNCIGINLFDEIDY